VAIHLAVDRGLPQSLRLLRNDKQSVFICSAHDAVCLRWNATSGRVWITDAARRRPEVAIHLSARAVSSHFGDAYCPSTHAKINGATIVASLSITNFGVVAASFPQVIFSLGTAPE
jgi:hypothetical protein